MSELLELCQNGADLQKMQKLIDSNIDINYTNDKDFDALMLLCEHNPSVDGINLLLKAKIDQNFTPFGENALTILCRYNPDPDCIKLLLDAGFKTKSKFKTFPNNALSLLCSSEKLNLESMKLLVDAKADLNEKSRYYSETPLVALCRRNKDLKYAQFLIDSGADVNKKFCSSVVSDVFLVACLHTNYQYMKFLIDSKKLSYPINPESLLVSCTSRRATIDCIKLLLDAGVDIKYKNRHGRNALLELCGSINPNPEIMKLLIDANVDINEVDNRGFNALSLLLYEDEEEEYEDDREDKICQCMKILIDNKIDINHIVEGQGNALTYVCIFSCNFKYIKILVDAGIKVDQEDSRGYTPLNYLNMNREKNIDAINLIKSKLV